MLRWRPHRRDATSATATMARAAGIWAFSLPTATHAWARCAAYAYFRCRVSGDGLFYRPTYQASKMKPRRRRSIDGRSCRKWRASWRCAGGMSGALSSAATKKPSGASAPSWWCLPFDLILFQSIDCLYSNIDFCWLGDITGLAATAGDDGNDAGGSVL